jgi:hypothetical protein
MGAKQVVDTLALTVLEDSRAGGGGPAEGVVIVRLRDHSLSAEKAAVAAVADSGWDLGRGAGFEVCCVEFGHARREDERVDAGVNDAEDDDVDPVG